MTKVKPLAPTRLRTRLKPSAVPYEDSRAIPDGRTAEPQPRALQALELALHIKDGGYNVYLAGEPNLGRTYMVQRFLAPRAAKSPVPPDILYVFNFEDQDRPRAIKLPPGQGRAFKQALSAAMNKLRKDIPERFDQESYFRQRQEIRDTYQGGKQSIFHEMESEATRQGFNLNMDEDGGMTLYPLMEGKILSEDEYDKLDSGLRKSLKRRGDKLLLSLNEFVRRMNHEDQELKEAENNLDRQVVSLALAEHVDPLIERFGGLASNGVVKEHIEAIKEDLLDNIDQFTIRDQPQLPIAGIPTGEQSGAADEFFTRYEINLFVDHADTKGAPIVIEDHPTHSNLLGMVEREAELGALITDFSLIKAGALHRALGGFLILHMEDILQYSTAWEALMRALRSGQAKIEEPNDGQEPSRTKSIEPEPLPIEVKVILVGTDETYELLLEHEDRFPKLFKIKAHLQETVVRDAGSIKGLLVSLKRIIDEASLPPFDREALAGLVDESSRLSEDQRKLSLKLPLLRELMIESAAMATMDGLEIVGAANLRKAIVAKHYRSNLYEETFMEEYDRELIKVSTSGEAVGRVNGLSVTWFGDFEFGLPHQIACTVGVGHEGVIDLEREADLGGPIHTKAMMILKSYLLGLFAQDKPIILSGSLCFEQSYAQVEGDSASAAELAALLSSLAGVPLNLSLAFTGAVNQSGDIMAVGGVTPKIEGFFEVCRRRGLSGKQGVLIPMDNVPHLMLKQPVVDAVEAGQFQIYPVRHIEEALELLTGRPAGKRLKSGGFSKDSLYQAVDQRLAELAHLGEREYKRRRR